MDSCIFGIQYECFNRDLFTMMKYCFMEIFIYFSCFKAASVLKFNMRDREIFAEQLLSFFHHTTSTIFLLYTFQIAGFNLTRFGTVDDNTLMFSTPIPEQYNFIYNFETAHYIVALFYQFFIKKIKRNDTFIHYLHHFITIILLTYINSFPYLRQFLTTYILVTHNSCDILLTLYHMEKVFVKYNIGKTLTKYSNIFYSIPVIWIYNRMLLYGTFLFICIRKFDEYSHCDIYNIQLLFILAILLYILNIIWLKIMLEGAFLKMIKKEKDAIYE